MFKACVIDYKAVFHERSPGWMDGWMADELLNYCFMHFESSDNVLVSPHLPLLHGAPWNCFNSQLSQVRENTLCSS